MKFYQEIKIMPNPKVPLNMVQQQVFRQLHLALADLKEKAPHLSIGVSFPEYIGSGSKKRLGRTIRLFAKDKKTFFMLYLLKYFRDLMKSVRISQVNFLPKEKIKGYAVFSRKQVATSAERLARHRIKTRNDMDMETAIKYYEGRVKMLHLPFVLMKSASNGHHFRLFIDMKLVEKPVKGEFTTYGLSYDATVPLF